LSVELAGIHPTRIELVRLRRRKALAEGIVDILKKDLDALTASLFELAQGITALRTQIRDALSAAYGLFVEAEMIAGSRKVEEISLVAKPIEFDIQVGSRGGVLGIPLPTFQLVEGTTNGAEPRYSLLETPAKLDESSFKIKEAFTFIVRLAEAGASINEILDVMSVKRRQINRLQYKVLPQLDAAIRYIELILEETERQDAIRVRVLQRKRKERGERA